MYTRRSTINAIFRGGLEVFRSWYDVAEICMNGHVTNSSVNKNSQHCQDYCEKCGEKTIRECQDCSTPIRGKLHVEGGFGSTHYYAPSYCHKCGNPFPWTEATLKAAKELAQEVEEFSQEDIDIFTASLDDLIVDNPHTKVAAVKFKKILSKAQQPMKDAIYQLLIDTVSETARKIVWPDI